MIPPLSPSRYKILLGTLGAVFLAIAGYSLVRHGSVTNDENWFREPPSHIYVTRPIPAELLGKTPGPDSLLVGDLLIRTAREEEHLTPEDLHTLLARVPPDTTLEVWIHRTAEDEVHIYRVRAGALTDSVLRDTGPTAYVFYVFPGGASDRAGMKAGDLILRINGEGFRNIQHADAIMRRAQAGKTLDYEVLRDNRTHVLHVTLAPFGFSVGFLVMFFTGIFYMGTGLFLGLKRPALRPARLLGLEFLLIGFGLAVILIQRDLSDPIFVTARTALRSFALLLGIAAALHAGHYFPRERPELIRRRWIRGVAYALAILFGVGSFFQGYGAMPGIIVMLLYTAGVFIVFRKSEPAGVRQITRPVVWASVIGTVFAFAVVVTVILFIAYSGELVIGYMGLGLLAIPLAHLYAIGRHRLLELDLRLRRNFQYLLAASAWRLATFALYGYLLLKLASWTVELPAVRFSGLALEILDRPAQGADQLMMGKTLAIAIALVLTLLFWWLGRQGLAYLARKFHRAKYDYRRAANELSTVMATRLSMQALAQGMVQTLGALMAVKRVGVMFFRDQSTCCCQDAFGFDGSVWQELCMGIHMDLAAALRGLRAARRVDDLPPAVKDELQRLDFQLVVPIQSNNRLIGAILLGEKESESAYDREDFDFLASSSLQASVSIENAFLYEELAVQERLRHELEIARRIQLESLPQRTPQIPGLDIAGISQPALEVGGDYFDYLNGVGQVLTVIVGDVSGKGTSAALYMSKVQGILRSLHGFGLGPRELFLRANQLLYGDMERKSFITALGATFDTPQRTMLVARAGHLPLYRLRVSTGEVERIKPRGLGLALNNGSVFAEELEERRMPYEPGDILLFVTDGVTEARRADGEQFGEAGVELVLRENASASAATIRDRLLDRVAAFAGQERQHDDQTIVVVRALD